MPGEACVHLDRIVGHNGDVVAERLELLEASIPGDRLVLAVGSPVERAREHQYQATPPGERLEIPVLVVLVADRERMRNLLPHPRTIIKCVMALRGTGRHSCQSNHQKDRTQESRHLDFDYFRLFSDPRNLEPPSRFVKDARCDVRSHLRDQKRRQVERQSP